MAHEEPTGAADAAQGFAVWLAEQISEGRPIVGSQDYAEYVETVSNRGFNLVDKGVFLRTLGALLGPAKLARVHVVQVPGGD